MRKFRFELARDDCANTLWRTKFRLPRRINFRFLKRLNLKCALLWRKFKARLLKAVRAPRNFKIYRASSIRRVNLDTPLPFKFLKSCRLASSRKFRDCVLRA